MAGLRFIDLFAGLGGFHQALSALGHRCVFASELDPALAELYERNFGIKPAGDIREAYRSVPAHDILCAGFPCQPFSKAGEQLGLACRRDGKLFDEIVRLLRHHLPARVLLENVANLRRHDGGATFVRMTDDLRVLGYAVDARVLSPHKFGIPRVRDRLFVVASCATGSTASRGPNRPAGQSDAI